MYNSDEFILSGCGTETFESDFAIHGFGYVEVVGDYDSIELTVVTAHTDLRTVSSFSCGNKTLNNSHNACIQSIKRAVRVSSSITRSEMHRGWAI